MKKSTQLLFSIFLSVSLFLSNSYATVWIVDAGGGGDFTTIQAAVNDSGLGNGDTILVTDGPYTESVDLTLAEFLNLTILAENLGSTTINSNGSAIFTISSSMYFSGNITIEGFVLSTPMTFSGSAIDFSDVEGEIHIRNNSLDGFGHDGGNAIRITVSRAIVSEIHIEQNTIRNGAHNRPYIYIDLQMANSNAYIFIDGNTMSGMQDDGIEIDILNSGENHIQISDNVIQNHTGTGDGIFADCSLENNSVTRLLIYKNQVDYADGDGIQVDFYGPNSGNSPKMYLVVEENQIRDCEDNGINVRTNSNAGGMTLYSSISSNIIENCGEDGIGLLLKTENTASSVTSHFNVVIDDNYITNPNQFGGDAGIFIDGDHSFDKWQMNLEITDNEVDYPNLGCIIIDKATDRSSTITMTESGNNCPATINDPGSDVSTSTNAVDDDKVPAILGDFVWEDTNGDGNQATEPGVGGVRFSLSGTQNLLDAAIFLTTVSMVDGNYYFPPLLPGTYTVIVTVPSAYYGLTTQDNADDDIDSDFDPLTYSTVVTFTDSRMDIDAGLLTTPPCEDTDPPTISCPSDQTRNLSACDYKVEDFFELVSTDDDCGPESVTQNPGIGTILNGVGDHLVTMTVEDGATNTASCDFTLSLEDNAAPVIHCPADQTVECDLGTHPSVTGEATATDNCDPSPVISHSDVVTAGSCAQELEIARVWTALDNKGNTSSCTQTIKQVDNTDPVLSCPADITISCSLSDPPSTSEPIAPDNCDPNPVLSFSDVISAGNCPQEPVTTRTWTLTDACGNQDACDQLITIADTDPPSANCVDTVVYLDEDGVAYLTAGMVDGGSTDNCDNAPILSVSPMAFFCGETGPQTVTLTVTDACGNSSTCSATVMVLDTIAPTFDCMELWNQPGSVTIVGSLQSELGCPGDWQPDCAITHLAYYAEDHAWQGTFTIPAGNWEYKAAMNDSWDEHNGAHAVPGGANIGLSLGAETQVKFYYDPVSHWVTDNVNGLIVTAPGSYQDEIGCPGDWMPWCLASWLIDPDGDQVYTSEIRGVSPGSYEVKIAINESWDENYGAGGVPGGPNIPFTVPQNSDLIYFSFDWNTKILSISTYPDPCLLCAPASHNPSTVSIPGNFQTELGCPEDWQPDCAFSQLVFDAEDQAWQESYTIPGGNWKYKAAINDSWEENYGANAILDGDSIELNLGGQKDVKFYYDPKTRWVTDNVNGLIVTAAGNYQSVVGCSSDWDPACLASWLTDPDGDGIYTRSFCNIPPGDYETKIAINESWDENYGAGGVQNGSNIFFTVPEGSRDILFSFDWSSKILTITADPFVWPEDVTVSTDPLTCYATVPDFTRIPLALDNCTDVWITQNPQPLSLLGPGKTNVLLTAMDGYANSSTWSFDFTVIDNTPPLAECQNFTSYLDINGTTNINPADVESGSTDNCGQVNAESVAPSTFSCSNIGPNTITLTVNDGNGNTSTCTAVVTVQDTVSPTAACQNVTVQLDAGGNGSTSAAAVESGSTDNCGTINLQNIQPNSFDCTNVGPNTVTLTVHDGNGNTASCTAIAIVEDNIDPIAGCQHATVQLDASGSGSVTAAAVESGSTDNCGQVNAESIAPSTFSCSNIGPNTVTLAVNDGNGNTSTCTANVVVEDNILPVARCRDITLLLDAQLQAVAQADSVDNGSGDNCAVISVFLNRDSFACSDLGESEQVLTVLDQSANEDTCHLRITIENDPAAVGLCCLDGQTQNHFITQVSEYMSGQSNVSGDDNGYGDYTNITFSPPSPYYQFLYFLFTPGGAFDLQNWEMYIDWNDNDLFEAGEKMMDYCTSSPFAHFLNLSGYPDGLHRMRLIMQTDTDNDGCQPGELPADLCGPIGEGEVEDYLVEIISFSQIPKATEKQIVVFPNPFKNEYIITVEPHFEIGSEIEIQMVNSYGQSVRVIKELYSGEPIHIETSDLPSGPYFIRVKTREIQFIKTIIKQE